ncbi:DUF3472 domain-containing protein [Alienimonas californiensis]|uniref:Uncharacterized protein n=1 Tax=Alienimonas californiensis TaxID=2527989 RepID=A0A517P800_9PLAN|nr:DUF3472 domain-containing protein [Alienimonas californiensis]QDT15510.1 hypothetical protein CA12_15950 [Alienimonas californiensis]
MPAASQLFLSRLFVASSALAVAIVAAPQPAGADERLAGKACRSVHLRLPAPKAEAFYQEMTVRESAPGTYFMACGWNRGYFGIQELANGEKLALFSVWEPPAGQNPDLVPEDRRVELRSKGEESEVKRFGGEGTGGQCFLKTDAADWEIGDVCRFLLVASVDQDETGAPIAGRTAYTGYFSRRAQGEESPGPWQKMATFSTLTPTQAGEFEPLRSLYTFVEDFRRNGVSLTQRRTAEFGAGWVWTVPDATAKAGAGLPRWEPLNEAQFTADGNPAQNVNATTLPGETPTQVGRFTLSTGGDTPENADRLGESLTRPTSLARIAPRPPSDLPFDPSAD